MVRVALVVRVAVAVAELGFELEPQPAASTAVAQTSRTYRRGRRVTPRPYGRPVSGSFRPGEPDVTFDPQSKRRAAASSRISSTATRRRSRPTTVRSASAIAVLVALRRPASRYQFWVPSSL